MQGGTATLTSFTPITDKTVQSGTDFTVAFTLSKNLYKDSVIDI